MAKAKTTKSKPSQKFMIYFIGLIMLLSAFYWITERPPQGEASTQADDVNVSGLVKYAVAPAGNGSAVVRVERPLNEIVAVPKRLELMRAEVVSDVLNASFSGVSKTTVELSNAYILFRFQVDDVPSVIDNVSSEIRSFVGDVRVYRAYDALIGGGRIYLLAEDGLSRGDFVRAIILERQDNFQVIGLQQGLVAVGPVVPAKVTALGDFYLTGKVAEKINESVLSSNVGASDVRYSENLSLSFTVPSDSNLDAVLSQIGELGVAGVRVYRNGFVSLPAEIAIGDDILQPASGEYSPALLSATLKVNDSVNVSISYEKEGGRLSSVVIRDASLL
jgi:hypothetical protein